MSIDNEFKNPSKDYSPTPLWFWYGKLEKEKISWQIDQMVDKGVYNAFLHPRAYLITKYLEEEWWDIIHHSVEHSRKVGFHPWLYDEYAWPSGTAGSTFKFSSQVKSRVLSKGEVNMGKGLRYRTLDVNGPLKIQNIFEDEKEKPINLISMKLDENGKVIDESLNNISNVSDVEINIEHGKYRIMAFYRFVVPTSVDYLNKDTIKYFIECTHEQYRKRYGEDFGSLIPGIFFDEIFNAAKPIVWSDNFEKEFLNRKGYDIKSFLPFLIYDGGEKTSKTRMDYFDVLTVLYEEAFFKQIGDWCQKNKLLLIGHTEEWLVEHPLQQGNYFRTMKHLHIPGADCHDYRYKYPRIISPQEPKDSVSVSRLYNKERCMSESMGGGGWATTLQEFKRGINVLAAMGINFFVLHGFYYENEHQGSQGDWPTSFFFQNPYWKYFKLFSTYISRLSLINSKGSHVCDVGLFYPIGTIYKDFKDGYSGDEAKLVSKNYNEILESLINHQVDADIIDEDSIINSIVEKGKFKMGKESISLLILPNIVSLKDDTKIKLKEFEASGGSLLFYNCGEFAADLEEFTDPTVISDFQGELINILNNILSFDFKVLEGNAEKIYYNHRIIEEKDFYFVVNGEDKKKEIKIRVKCSGIPKVYSVENGEQTSIQRYFNVDDKYTDVILRLHEDEAVYIVFDKLILREKQSEVSNKNDFGVIELDKNWSVIPASSKYDEKWGVTEDEVEMKIPIAEFKSDLNEKAQTIRICNTKDELGNCGRHLGLWKASWITRRPSWSDNSSSSILYFRKKLNITSIVVEAKLCIAAVDRFELFINGVTVTSGKRWQKPTIVDISSYLTIGQNIIAVKLENDNPIQGVNVLEAEVLPAEGLTSLLLQGKVKLCGGVIEILSDDSWISNDSYCENWNSCKEDYEKDAIRINSKEISDPREDTQKSSKWLYCWKRGLPPISPWGQIPLFGSHVEFPLNVEYTIELPLGTKKVLYPKVKGIHSICFDNEIIMKEQFVDDCFLINDKTHKHQIKIQMQVDDLSYGLLLPVKVIVGERSCSLGDWCADGLKWFSGRMIYTNNINLVENDSNKKCILNMNKVDFHAEVWINKKLVGTRIWKPYKLDISKYLVKGQNELTIVVSNLAANRIRYNLVDEGVALAWNRYWNDENITRDSQNLISGLIGPVNIEVMKHDN